MGVISMPELGTRSLMRASFAFQSGGAQPAGGLAMNSAETSTITPWMMPNTMNVCWYPEFLIIDAMGATLTAVPMPYAPAVNPTQRPRWSGNHLRALPMVPP